MPTNLYCTRLELPPAPAAALAHRDRQDPELWTHLQGFQGYVLKMAGERSAHVFRVLQAIAHVRHQVVVEAYGEEWAEFARASLAIMFESDGSVRDPDGRVLVGPERDDAAAVPMAPDAPMILANAREWLAERGYAVPEHLTPGIGAVQAHPRPAGEVVQRGLTLLAVASRADSFRDGAPVGPEFLARFGELAPTPAEQAFLEATEPGGSSPDVDARTINGFSWGFESGAALIGVAGQLALDPHMAKQIDVPQVLEHIRSVGAESIMSQAQLPSLSEQLELAARARCANWVVRDAVQVKQGSVPAGLEMGVVAERHRAYNWLTGQWGEGWDDVDTPT